MTGFSDERLCLQRDLLGVQHLLNSSEASLHQLTALLDCRGLNKVCLLCVLFGVRAAELGQQERS